MFRNFRAAFCSLDFLKVTRSLLIEWASLARAPRLLARALTTALRPPNKVHDRASRSVSSTCKQVYL